MLMVDKLLDELIYAGTTYLDSKNYDKALDTFNYTLKMYPNSKRAMLCLMMTETKHLTLITTDIAKLKKYNYYYKKSLEIRDDKNYKSQLKSLFLGYVERCSNVIAKNRIKDWESRHRSEVSAAIHYYNMRISSVDFDDTPTPPGFKGEEGMKNYESYLERSIVLNRIAHHSIWIAFIIGVILLLNPSSVSVGLCLIPISVFVGIIDFISVNTGEKIGCYKQRLKWLREDIEKLERIKYNYKKPNKTEIAKEIYNEIIS